ncbi:MAG: hypothetical protein LLG00_04440 [Planctomycetaceae bacterium]|nr:hypothetical protein [Planctomycetaceae bacterium]
MKRSTTAIVGVAILGLAAAGYGIHSNLVRPSRPVSNQQPVFTPAHRFEAIEIETTEYSPPKVRAEPELVDEQLSEKHPKFDATLVDSRPLQGWEVNASAAVVSLDCPMIKPDVEGKMLLLRPSYAKAVRAAKEEHRGNVLPSANMLDGAAKQFDDGLYAALDLACFQGQLGFAPAAPEWVAAVLGRLPATSPARPFLAASLQLAGKDAQLTSRETQEKDRLLAEFEQDKTVSKPIGFYDWTPELKQVWRFYRFLQYEFTDDTLEVPRDVAAVLKTDSKLRETYRSINGFYGRLTCPLISLPVDLLIDANKNLPELAKQHGVRRPSVAIFPPSTSRETELFEQLFPQGVPPKANLMTELIRRIRSGEVELKPSKSDGWYQYQVYALQTLLLPSDGQERDKLLLMASYKKRLAEAFQAMVTKRRETHARQTMECKSLDSEEPDEAVVVSPRLRIEPCATFYLRTARAYAFVQDFLRAMVGQPRLSGLHGLRQGGQRKLALDAELDAIRQRFYGFYLVACEDIGMKPRLLDDELVDQAAAKQAALKWLETLETDPDVACDTRVSVPIYVDPMRGNTRIWATLGVRLAHLEARYARPPQIRPKGKGGPWTKVEPWRLDQSRYVIPVDDFAEIELPGPNVLSREELRSACDRYGTKEAIVRALSGR